MLSVGRRLASRRPGRRHDARVGGVRSGHDEELAGDDRDRRIARWSPPACDGRFPPSRSQMSFAGLTTTAWVTDTGEIVREESPMGLITVLETQEQATALAVSNRMREDMLEASAIVPRDGPPQRINEPRDVKRLRLRLTGADLIESRSRRATGRRVDGDVIELIDPRDLTADADARRSRSLPAARAVHRKRRAGDSRRGRTAWSQGVTGVRARAERLTREVNTLVEKKPDGEPAVGARSAAHQGRRLQRAHGAVRGAGALARHSRAHQRRCRLRARRVLLPRVARGLHRRGQGPRPVAARRSDVQPVSRRRHARAPGARRPRQADRDPAADRPGEDDRGRRRGRRRTRRRSWSAGRRPTRVRCRSTFRDARTAAAGRRRARGAADDRRRESRQALRQRSRRSTACR